MQQYKYISLALENGGLVYKHWKTEESAHYIKISEGYDEYPNSGLLSSGKFVVDEGKVRLLNYQVFKTDLVDKVTQAGIDKDILQDIMSRDIGLEASKQEKSGFEFIDRTLECQKA